jgi:hypothetical protein
MKPPASSRNTSCKLKEHSMKNIDWEFLVIVALPVGSLLAAFILR